MFTCDPYASQFNCVSDLLGQERMAPCKIFRKERSQDTAKNPLDRNKNQQTSFQEDSWRKREEELVVTCAFPSSIFFWTKLLHIEGVPRIVDPEFWFLIWVSGKELLKEGLAHCWESSSKGEMPVWHVYALRDSIGCTLPHLHCTCSPGLMSEFQKFSRVLPGNRQGSSELKVARPAAGCLGKG